MNDFLNLVEIRGVDGDNLLNYQQLFFLVQLSISSYCALVIDCGR